MEGEGVKVLLRIILNFSDFFTKFVTGKEEGSKVDIFSIMYYPNDPLVKQAIMGSNLI